MSSTHYFQLVSIDLIQIHLASWGEFLTFGSEFSCPCPQHFIILIFACWTSHFKAIPNFCCLNLDFHHWCMFMQNELSSLYSVHYQHDYLPQKLYCYCKVYSIQNDGLITSMTIHLSEEKISSVVIVVSEWRSSYQSRNNQVVYLSNTNSYHLLVWLPDYYSL